MWATTLWHHGLPLVQWGVTCGASALAAVIDARTRRIPNWITGPTFLAGMIWSCWMGGWAGGADALVAGLALALPYVLLFAFAGGGAGDAKLMAAVGAWLGLINGGVALFAVALCGVVLGLVYAAIRKQSRASLVNAWWLALSLLASLMQRRTANAAGAPPAARATVPYGVAICAGVIVAAIGVGYWRSVAHA
ncbi:MAG: A24 family peptidase [Planctomycetota bacterium]